MFHSGRKQAGRGSSGTSECDPIGSEEVKWKRIIFSDKEIYNDVIKFRYMSDVFNVGEGETVYFLIDSSPEITDFYIGSHNILSLHVFSEFLRRIYDLSYEDRRPEIHIFEQETYVIKDRSRMFRYFPQMGKFLASCGEMLNFRMVISVGLTSVNKGRFLCSYRVMRVDPIGDLDLFRKRMRELAYDMKKIADMKMVKTSNKRKFLFRPYVYKRSLINVFRIPQDDDFS